MRDIGLEIVPIRERCNDKRCPFHGELAVRGQIIEGVVVSDHMDKTVVVQRVYLKHIQKYERYERRRSKILAHNPPCINAKRGEKVKIMECRPLSKGKNFVVIERKKE